MKLKSLIISALAAISMTATSPAVFAADGNGDADNTTTHGHFTWGASAGSSIDMSGNDMASVDIAAMLGYRRGWIKFLGLGAEMDIMVNNSCRSFPIYATLRTNFQSRPSLLFLDTRLGISVNYLPDDYSQTGAYGFIGLGFNLASGKKFASHMVIGYTFKERKDYSVLYNSPHDDSAEPTLETLRTKSLHMATVRLGITF